MNNDIFCWKRFCKVVRHDAAALPSQYGMHLLVLALLPAALWLLMLVLGDNESAAVPAGSRLMLLMTLTLLAAFLTPSRLYRSATLPREGIYYAMLPASKLEKYLSMLLYTFVICPLLVMAAMLLIDVLLSTLPFGPFREQLWAAGGPFASDDPYYGGGVLYMLRPGMLAVLLLLLYVERVALFLLGSTCFKRYKFLKTLLALWVLRFVCMITVVPVFLSIADGFETGMAAWDHADNMAELVRYVANIAMAVLVAVDGVLLWWSGRRMEKMKY